MRQAKESRRTEGEAAVRFFRKGVATPTVIRLAKGDRILSLVFHPFLQTVSVYETDVDFPFTERMRGAGR